LPAVYFRKKHFGIERQFCFAGHPGAPSNDGLTLDSRDTIPLEDYSSAAHSVRER
jgi:hypothetical protein